MVINEVFAAQQLGLPVLSLLVALPVAVAIVVALCSSIRWAHAVATVGAAAELAIAVWLVAELVPGTTDIVRAASLLFSRVRVSTIPAFTSSIGGIVLSVFSVTLKR